MAAEWGGGYGSALAPGPRTRGHRTALAYADRLPPGSCCHEFKFVVLHAVLVTSNHTQVFWAVKTANSFTLQGNDVIDFMLNAGLSSQLSGLHVKSFDCCPVGSSEPRRGCKSLDRTSLGCCVVDLATVVGCPDWATLSGSFSDTSNAFTVFCITLMTMTVLTSFALVAIKASSKSTMARAV